MIDKIQAVVPYEHTKELSGGVIESWDANGEMTWSRTRRQVARGSWDGTCTVRSQNRIGESRWSHVHIDGCPGKLLQGHNLFGSDDVLGLLAMMMAVAMETCGQSADDFTLRRITEGRGVQLIMIDITYSYSLGDRASVRSYLRALSHTATIKHRGRGVLDHGTLYWGKRSSYWAYKLYGKADEIDSPRKGHRLSGLYDGSLFGKDGRRLRLYAEPLLRGEFRLLPKELKRLGLDDGEPWARIRPQQLYDLYTERMTVSEQKMHEERFLHQLTPSQLAAYQAWKSGRDVAQLYSRSQLWRHRRVLLQYGVDIAVTHQPEESNVVQMVKVLKPQPVDVPEWAKGGRVTYADPAEFRKRIKA